MRILFTGHVMPVPDCLHGPPYNTGSQVTPNKCAPRTCSLCTLVAHALIRETWTLLYANVSMRACGHALCAMGYGYQGSGA
jgi:hypothetical protein